MGLARMKPDNGHEFSGQDFDFERSSFLADKVIVDFDPGPEVRIGIYSEEEFAATFDVLEE